MSGRSALFDSNIIIYLSKKELDLSYIDRFEDLFVSVITYMEILGYDFHDNAEEEYVRELLGLFTVKYIDKEIADKVIEIRKKEKVKLPDAIVAATAAVNNLCLVTRDVKDFKGINIDISNPYED
ncbi:MAG: type II toxin-antitoxin system VapC family toxin [Deltaproteobacteria bacterium]|nr:type II toxin-antitoxin system VapC family toxin [Deltaproteobacteria bacterium]